MTYLPPPLCIRCNVYGIMFYKTKDRNQKHVDNSWKVTIHDAIIFEFIFRSIIIRILSICWNNIADVFIKSPSFNFSECILVYSKFSIYFREKSLQRSKIFFDLLNQNIFSYIHDRDFYAVSIGMFHHQRIIKSKANTLNNYLNEFLCQIDMHYFSKTHE